MKKKKKKKEKRKKKINALFILKKNRFYDLKLMYFSGIFVS